MAEKDQKENNNEFSFVTEQIRKPKINKRIWLIRALGATLLAILFGGMAGVTFAFVLPYAQSKWPPSEQSRETVTIPRDEQPTTSEAPTTTLEVVTTEPATTEAPTTEPIEDVVQGILDEKVYTVEDYASMYTALYQVVAGVNQSIVTVTSVENSIDWFNHPFELEGETSGLVYNKTDQEILILTDARSIHNADDIRITFSDGVTCQGVLRKFDTVTNMAVIAVDVLQLEEGYLETVTIASLGNSYVIKIGDPVVAVGNPFGYTYSMSYGIVSSVRNMAQAVDCNLRLINTNILEGASGTGFLINLTGEVIGFITKEYKSDTTGSVTTAIAISDLKGTLERLSNGEEIPYFGIYGQEVTLDISEEMGLPLGVYVAESIAGSPVYQAGVQSGDVITSWNGQDVKNMKMLRTYLESSALGEELIITVMRQGIDEYKEIEFAVVLTSKDDSLE